MSAATDWMEARRRYEAGKETVTAIARDLAISPQSLVGRARTEGWTPREAPAVKPAGTRATIARLKLLLQQRLLDLESQIGALGEAANAASSERDIRAMNTLVRTLEKVLELERKDRAQRCRQRRHHRQFDDAERAALADKLDGLRRELDLGQQGPGGSAEHPPGATPEPRLAPVGAGGKPASTPG
jgi:hypothetical protein